MVFKPIRIKGLTLANAKDAAASFRDSALGYWSTEILPEPVGSFTLIATFHGDDDDRNGPLIPRPPSAGDDEP
jgi:hypothetical protein